VIGGLCTRGRVRHCAFGERRISGRSRTRKTGQSSQMGRGECKETIAKVGVHLNQAGRSIKNHRQVTEVSVGAVNWLWRVAALNG